MARLLPEYLIRASRCEWLTGPMARNSGANTASDGTEQTFVGIGDVVAFRYTLPPSMNRQARRERGNLLALHSGANAVRIRLLVGDDLSPSEAGLVEPFGAQTWSNGQAWDNGGLWAVSYPDVPLAAAAALDDGIVKIADQYWGHNLGIGDPIGFYPFYFGAHFVTEIINPGEYRIWPRLRKALTTSDYATLHPVLVMRTKPGGATMVRGAVHTEGNSVELVEVFDYHVRGGEFEQ